MRNEDRMLAGAGLERWFGDWVQAIAGALRGIADRKIMPDNGMQHVRAHLANLHPYVEHGTQRLDPAMAAVLNAAEALVHQIVGGHATDPTHADRVITARAGAFDALAELADLLRIARPSGKATALYPQPGEPNYRPPELA